ncbi:MAG TPA: hypothetical protein PKB10_09575 [Tepidisphaeraceae bacterium]|nr:hypothetical protein [Tepidisphaeraceae bacterium]
MKQVRCWKLGVLGLGVIGWSAAGLGGFGCADNGPSARERQDAALRDPFGYGPTPQPVQQPVRGAREPRGPVESDGQDRRE